MSGKTSAPLPDPEVARNAGAFRPLTVIMPMGTVISAERPYPMRVWMTFPMTVIDTIFKAMNQAIPDRVIAGHHADLCVGTFHGDLHPGNVILADGKICFVDTGYVGRVGDKIRRGLFEFLASRQN